MMVQQSWLKRFYIFAGIEVVAGLLVAAGVGVEIAYGADLGWILISVGSLLVAFGSGLWAKVYIGWRG